MTEKPEDVINLTTQDIEHLKEQGYIYAESELKEICIKITLFEND